MERISGLEISREIVESLKKVVKPSKAMAAVLVGDDPISANFVNEKKKIAEELGIEFRIIKFPGDLSNADLRIEVNKIAGDQSIGGVVVQLPLPKHVIRHEILKDIPASKDVDVLGSSAVAHFYAGEEGILPPACAVVEDIVRRYGIDLAKSRVAVVGSGLLIGKPVSLWLMHKAKDILVLGHRSDLSQALRDADLVVSGVGKAKLITSGMLKAGASVIDFGYDYSGGKLVGDFDHSDEAVLIGIKCYTPTPGGTGPILVAKLFENFYKLNQVSI